MALPVGGAPVDAQEAEQPSRTYRIDFDSGRIVGVVDGVEAVKQAAFAILSTVRFHHFIYSGDYGAELQDGPDLEARIEEALLRDDRITGIADFTRSDSGDTSSISLTIISIFGSFAQEVSGIV